MLRTSTGSGFEVAEALEPAPPRERTVADVVGVAEFLGPPDSASRAEVDRSAAAVSDAAGHDGQILQEAEREARRRASQGRCAQGVVSLLSRARRQWRQSRRGALPGRRAAVRARHSR